MFGRLAVKRQFGLTSLLLGLPMAAAAAYTQISDVPTNWRLENYPGGPVQLWFTPSPCTNGGMTLPVGATPADMNRLWALILAAKLSNRKVFVYYDNASVPASCPIVSFGMDN
jgi:hypothetical protein